MLRKIIKRHSPSTKSIQDNRFLRIFGDSLHRPNLWLLNRHTVSKAFAIGIFCTWVPFPFQTVLAAFLAIYYRAHLALSVALVFISNPITIPPMFYFAYKLGSVMLGRELQAVDIEFSWHWFNTIMGQIWQPLVFGCIVLAIATSATAYFLINTLWRKGVRDDWKDRASRRQAKSSRRSCDRK